MDREGEYNRHHPQGDIEDPKYSASTSSALPQSLYSSNQNVASFHGYPTHQMYYNPPQNQAPGEPHSSQDQYQAPDEPHSSQDQYQAPGEPHSSQDQYQAPDEPHSSSSTSFHTPHNYDSRGFYRRYQDNWQSGNLWEPDYSSLPGEGYTQYYQGSMLPSISVSGQQQVKHLAAVPIGPALVPHTGSLSSRSTGDDTTSSTIEAAKCSVRSSGLQGGVSQQSAACEEKCKEEASMGQLSGFTRANTNLSTQILTDVPGSSIAAGGDDKSLTKFVTETKDSERTLDTGASVIMSDLTCSSSGVCSEVEIPFRNIVQDFVTKYSSVINMVKETGSKQLMTTKFQNSQNKESFKYAEPDALEFYMQVCPSLRQKKFFKIIEPGDIVQCYVISKSRKELVVQITSFVGSHKLRELRDLDVKGVVTFENLSDEKQEDVWTEMRPRDVIQGVVLSLQELDLLVYLSFKESHVKQLCCNGETPAGVYLGYIEGKRPASKVSSFVRSNDFLANLESDPGFSNPSCTNNLRAVLGVRMGNSDVSGIAETLGPGLRPTLFSDIQMAEYSEGDYCHVLRKAQRNKWSMETVAIGVQHFKSGDHSKAVKFFHHALDIDPDNVEGLVARGALYANGGKFKEGIMDFEKALTLKSSHKNARKYLVETQVAYGEELEKRGKLQEAARCYREALADDPGQKTAKQRLDILTAIFEKQAAERKEKEKKREEEEKTFKKIQKLLEKEKNKETKTRSSQKKKQAKRKKTKKSSKKTKRKSSTSTRKASKKQIEKRPDYSSESDYSNDSTRSERSWSRSPSSPPHRKSARETSRREVRYSRSRSKSPHTSRHYKRRDVSSALRSDSSTRSSSSPSSHMKVKNKSWHRSRSRSPSPNVKKDDAHYCKQSLSPRRVKRTHHRSYSRSKSPLDGTITK